MAIRNAIGTKKITLGGSFTMTGGAYTFTGTLTANTAVTFPVSGTLATLSDIPVLTPQPLTKVDDTNITVTLGGTPATALLQPVTLTMGWTGQLEVTRGGTGLSTITQGDLIYGSGADTFSALS